MLHFKKCRGFIETYLNKKQKYHKAHLVEDLHRFVELYIPQEGGKVLEEINQQLRVHGPTLEDNISPFIQKFTNTFMGIE